MALRKQKVSVLFSKGAQTKVDQKALPIDDLVELENGEFNKIGRIDKRTGFTKVVDTAASLVAYKDDLISRNVRTTSDDNSTQASVYSTSGSEMRGERGWSSGLNYNSYPASKGATYSQKDPQVAVSNDGKYALVTFVSLDHSGLGATGGLAGHQGIPFGTVTKRCSVIDRQTNTVLAHDIEIGLRITTAGGHIGGKRMRPLWLNNKFYIFGEDLDLASATSDIRIWTIDPTESQIRLRDTAGTLSEVGTQLVAAANYPLVAAAAGATFPFDTVGASFDVCHSSVLAGQNTVSTIANVMFTRISGGVTSMAYYTYDSSNGAFTSKFELMIAAHGTASTSMPTYYTICNTLSETLGANVLFFAYQDGANFRIKETTDGATSSVTVVDHTFSGSITNFNTRCSFVENHLTAGVDSGVDAYASFSSVEAGSSGGTGIYMFPNVGAFSPVSPRRVGHGSLVFATGHKLSASSQKGPAIVAGYGADPIAADFAATGESLSENLLDTVKIWTSDLDTSVNVHGTDYTGKQYLHERDYLRYGSLETSHLRDALKVAVPGFEDTAAAIGGRVIAVPVATNYNTYDDDLVVNSLIHIYDFRDEEYVDKPKASTAILQDTLYVADNGLYSYDGERFGLHGITARPWIGCSVATHAYQGDNDLSDPDVGRYLYKGTLEWEDALGNLHQSEPSGHIEIDALASSHSLTYHPSNELISEYVSSTSYDSPAEIYKDLKFALYRTESNGATYNLNRITRNFSRTSCMKGVTDGKLDEKNALGRFLYTDTGELSNTPPPSPAIYVAAHKNRLFIIGKDRRVYFSKLAVPGYGLGFNPSLEIKLPDSATDRPVALGSMDGSLVILTEKSIYHVTGDGPDNLGTGGFYEPKKIPSVAGASYCTPVRLIDQGLLFTNKGDIFLLSREGKVTELGTPAYEMTKGKSILGITVDEAKKTVYFQTNNSAAAELVTYNYLFGQWGRHVLQGETSIDSVARYGDGLAVSAGDNLYFSSTGSEDGTAYVPLKLRTAWIKLDTYKGVHKFSSLQGYQRVYNFQILGEAVDAHVMHVNVYYDYDSDTIVDSYTYTTTDAHSMNPPKKLQLKGHLSKQKCNAIQFEIYDSATGLVPTDGEGFAISHIELEIGQKLDQYKDGLMKISGDQTLGVL